METPSVSRRQGTIRDTQIQDTDIENLHQTNVRRRVNSREDKSVPVDPAGVAGVELHELVEKDMGNRGHSHRCTRVARVRVGDRISLPQSTTYQHCRNKSHQESHSVFPWFQI